MLTQAIILSTLAHAKQLDKCGEPYILHPLRVMMCMPTDELKIIAVLHDIIEDTYITEEILRTTYNFSKTIVDAVVAISKYKTETYSEYINRLSINTLAKIVKIADIKDNSSPSRLYKLDPDTRDYLTKKYKSTLKFLESI